MTRKNQKNYSIYRRNLHAAKKLGIPRFITFGYNYNDGRGVLSGAFGNYGLSGFVAFPLENGDCLIKEVSGRITAQDENFVTIDDQEYFVNWHKVDFHVYWGDTQVYDWSPDNEGPTERYPVVLFP